MNISKMVKNFLFLLLIVGVLFTNLNVKAYEVSENITMASKNSIHYFDGDEAYINNYKFYFKKTTGGLISYCAGGANSKYPADMTLSLKGEADNGLTYIIANGYPYVSFTNDAKKDYYITQSAIWLYFDLTRSQNNWKGYDFSSAASGTMEYYVNKLARSAVSALSKGVVDTPSISLSIDTKDFTSSGQYNVSGLVTVNASNTSGTYKVSLEGAPEGTVILSDKGVGGNKFSVTDKFRIYVPVNTDFYKITVSVTVDNVTYKTYEYTSGNASYQDIITTTKVQTTKEKKCTIEFIKNEIVTPTPEEHVKVVVRKQYASTKQDLIGAKLVLKNQQGEVVDTWETDGNAHYVYDLPNGLYTLVEEKAPNGYELTDEVISFEIKDNSNVKEIVLYNTKYITVPRTALDRNQVVFITGCVLTLLGIGMVFKYAKGKE